MIHSNPRLGTQWAVRQVLDETGCRVRHLVKAEAPLGVNVGVIAARIAEALEASVVALGISAVDVLVLEIDVKRTQDRQLLRDEGAAADFYALGEDLCRVTGVVGSVYAYCHEPAHVLGALRCRGIGGVAAQYNLHNRWSALYVNGVVESGRAFVGMSPLDRGRLVDQTVRSGMRRLSALEWALADQRVSALAITTSNPRHLQEAIGLFERSHSRVSAFAHCQHDDQQPSRRDAL
ncbi:hypothetical protein [Myceligenerans pegani]|uniref:Uncharacterized protein n=1 Tax=Myceligenerans pegani TaxID=2776917 RepID=A0ABR9MWF2_9MICO|nr:hypothetical protein [Myceligenerans sp. TRM 65318]MBE1875729.1 hypothetical protein [Myceligenerans sp. TRM 65318]MBE3018000.1 hypothetical protein [Myceligenerans sp. TRM 65318]